MGNFTSYTDEEVGLTRKEKMRKSVIVRERERERSEKLNAERCSCNYRGDSGNCKGKNKSNIVRQEERENCERSRERYVGQGERNVRGTT